MNCVHKMFYLRMKRFFKSLLIVSLAILCAIPSFAQVEKTNKRKIEFLRWTKKTNYYLRQYLDVHLVVGIQPIRCSNYLFDKSNEYRRWWVFIIDIKMPVRTYVKALTKLCVSLFICIEPVRLIVAFAMEWYRIPIRTGKH